MFIVCLYFQIEIFCEMFEEEICDENVHLNLPKKLKLQEGNHALSAEILEQVVIMRWMLCSVIQRYFQGVPLSESRRPDDPVDSVQILGGSGRAAPTVDGVQVR